MQRNECMMKMMAHAAALVAALGRGSCSAALVSKLAWQPHNGKGEWEVVGWGNVEVC